MAPSQSVAGYVAPGFEVVRDAFAALELAGPRGAAFAVAHEGEMLVDLWGGGAGSAERAWQRDTVVGIFSGTKGLVAACLLALVEDGRLDPERPVAAYWPEFAAHGKQDITVADVATHRAGLPLVEDTLDVYDMLNPRRMAARLAGQAPLWPAPRPLAYGAMTFGWLAGELVRRVTGMGVGRFLCERFTGLRGLDVWIGIPTPVQRRVASLHVAPGCVRPTARHPLAAQLDNPPIFAEPLMWNLPRVREAELASSGGIGSPRAVATFYADLVRATRTPSLRPATTALGRTQRAHGDDAMYGDEMNYGLGWHLQTHERFLGPDPDGFGHTGAGGSVHGAWPEPRIGFSFAMSELRDEPTDFRARRLLAALWEALGGCA